MAEGRRVIVAGNRRRGPVSSDREGAASPASPKTPPAPLLAPQDVERIERELERDPRHLVIVKDGKDPQRRVMPVAPAGLNALSGDKLKARVAIVAALRANGYQRKDIAKALGVTVSTIAWLLRRAREQQLLEDGLTETIREIDQEAVPLALEGLLKMLRKGDKDAVFKTLDGRGVFKSHSSRDDDGSGGGAPNLQINIVNAPAGFDPKQVTGQIIGKPRED